MYQFGKLRVHWTTTNLTAVSISGASGNRMHMTTMIGCFSCVASFRLSVSTRSATLLPVLSDPDPCNASCHFVSLVSLAQETIRATRRQERGVEFEVVVSKPCLRVPLSQFTPVPEVQGCGKLPCPPWQREGLRTQHTRLKSLDLSPRRLPDAELDLIGQARRCLHLVFRAYRAVRGSRCGGTAGPVPHQHGKGGTALGSFQKEAA